MTNSPPWNGVDSEPLWGFGSSSYVPTFGELFTAPSGETTLDQFSLTLMLFPQVLMFSAELLAWDSSGFHPVGPALFSETTSAVAQTPGAYQSITFSPGVPMIAGNRYVFFLTTLGVSNEAVPSPAFTSFAATYADSYTGGQWVFSALGAGSEASTSVGSLNGVRWGSKSGCDAYGTLICSPNDLAASDLAFSAAFTSVPEPTAIALVATGLFGLICGKTKRL
jgi:hypothetical protein